MSTKVNRWEYKFFYACYLVSKDAYINYVSRLIDNPNCCLNLNVPEELTYGNLRRLQESEIEKNFAGGVYVIQTQEKQRDYLKYDEEEELVDDEGVVVYNKPFDTKLQYDSCGVTNMTIGILEINAWKKINKSKYVILYHDGYGNWTWEKLSYFRKTAFSKLDDMPITAVMFNPNNRYHIAFARRFVADYYNGIEVEEPRY